MKKISKIIMDWLNGFLQLPIELKPLSIQKDRCLLIIINDIDKLTLDHDKLPDLYNEMFRHMSINQLYEFLSDRGLAKDCKKNLKIYEKNRNLRLPIVITSSVYYLTILHIDDKY